MWLELLAAIFFADATKTPAPKEPKPAATYHSAKSLQALQKCLTENLSNVGEVVAVKFDNDTTTLVLRDTGAGSMTIDLAPPSVIVTSRLAPNTRHLVEACL